MTTPRRTPDPRPPMSALPSQAARALAFGSIVIGGLAGAVIGYGIVKVQCVGECTTQKAAGSIVGALFIGIGIAVVAVLVLRAMGEWNVVKEREAQVALGTRASLTAKRSPDPTPADPTSTRSPASSQPAQPQPAASQHGQPDSPPDAAPGSTPGGDRT